MNAPMTRSPEYLACHAAAVRLRRVGRPTRRGAAKPRRRASSASRGASGSSAKTSYLRVPSIVGRHASSVVGRRRSIRQEPRQDRWLTGAVLPTVDRRDPRVPALGSSPRQVEEQPGAVIRDLRLRTSAPPRRSEFIDTRVHERRQHPSRIRYTPSKHLGFAPITHASMSAEDEGLDRKNQRLDPQDHGMYEPDRIHRVENQPLGRPDFA
jgi:hypothetical protein